VDFERPSGRGYNLSFLPLFGNLYVSSSNTNVRDNPIRAWEHIERLKIYLCGRNLNRQIRETRKARAQAHLMLEASYRQWSSIGLGMYCLYGLNQRTR